MPGPRYVDWTHVQVRGDRDAAAPHVPYARKLLGYLAEQRQGGVKTQEIQRKLEDGTIVRAEFIGDIPRIQITTAGGGSAFEEVEHLFVSGNDGLRIYDMGRKKLDKLLTGLGSYLVQAVNPAGTVVWMTLAAPNNIAVMARVDVPALAALGKTYAVKTVATPDSDPPVDGLANNSDAAELSADGNTLLLHFGGSSVEGTIKEGVGGVLVLDPVTLSIRRPPIRMTFLPAPMAWAPDSSRFYLGCSRSDDVGDLPATTRLADLTESTTDYVAAFDRDGVLLGARALATWDFTPDAGWNRLVKGIAATDTRVYVTVQAGVGVATPAATQLVVLDATKASLPIVGTLDLTSISNNAPPNLCLTRGGDALLLSYTDRVAEIAVADDVLSIAYTSVHAQFATWAPNRSAAHPEIQIGPASRHGGKPDDRRFLLNYDTGIAAVRGYRTLALDDTGAPQPVYEFDLIAASPGISFKPSYRIASVGVRPRRTPA